MAKPPFILVNDKVLRLRRLEKALVELLDGTFGGGLNGGTPKTCPVDLIAQSLRLEIDVLLEELNRLKP